MEALNELLQSLPGYSLLSDTMKQTALQGARVPDGLGVWPGEPGYQDTFDVYFAALTLLPFLQSQAFVTSAGSEGTNVSVQPTDWGQLAHFFAGQSHIAAASRQGVIGTVAIPYTPHVKRVDMSGRDESGRRTSYDNVDTDLA